MTNHRDDGVVPEGFSQPPPTDDTVGWRKRAVRARLFQAPDTPARVGRFIVLGTLGSGGMGSVLRTYDETLDRQVAVKLLHPGVHEQHDRRMLREAQALARLSHPNVVQVYEVGEVDGQLFIAMELVAGQTLEQWQDTSHSWRQCLDAYVQAGRGLAAAHAAGMVHRDFKPSNCIMDEGGRVRVLDFGLARHSVSAEDEPPERALPSGGGEEPRHAESSSSVLEEKLTVTGSVLGTVAYMAPEQMQGRETDARADQYSFCVSLYEALFGFRPWPGGGKVVPTTASGSRLPMATSDRAPRWLVRVLERGLAEDPAARWPSMDALLDTLDRRKRRRSAGWVGVGVAVAGVMAGFVLAADEATLPEPPDPCHDVGRSLVEVWDDDERERVREAILSTELAFAPRTWESVQSQLDGYVETIGAAYVDACEATMVRHEATIDDLRLRSSCLDERVGAMRQTIAVLDQADAGVVENAVTMVVALPGAEPCAEAEVLRRASEGVRDARAHEQQREQLQQARALTIAGKPTEGLELVEPVVASATTLGVPALLAEARLVEGELQADLGRHGPAARTLRLALEGALEHGADTVAVEALCELVYLVGVEQAKADAGVWLGSMAEALVGRDRAGAQAQARVLTAVGQLASARGEHVHAQARLERAVWLLRTRVGEDHIALAEPLDSLGVALRNQGKLEAARQQYQRALDIRVRWQGPQHPSTLHQRINLGVVIDEQGEHEEAQQQVREALDILVASPVEHRELEAHARTSLAISLAKQTRYDEAALELSQAVAAWESVYGSEHPRVARARLSLAGVLRGHHRYEQAVAQYERALAVLRAIEPTASNEAMVVTVLDGLVKSLEILGRRDEAASHRATLERLEAIRR